MTPAERAAETRTNPDHREASAAARDRGAPGAGDAIEAQRFWDAADLSDACARLSPYRQEYFAISFDSFDDYASWRNAQANPWNR